MERVSSATATVEVEDAISTDQSSRSGRKRAKVWAHVDTEIIDGIEKAVCKYCKLPLSSVSGKGTTHLNRHIAYYCRSVPQEEFVLLEKKNSDAYPILSLMARDLSIVSSESAFSCAGRILGKNRTSLCPETLQGLVCAKDWLFGFTDADEGELMTGRACLNLMKMRIDSTVEESALLL